VAEGALLRLDARGRLDAEEGSPQYLVKASLRRPGSIEENRKQSQNPHPLVNQTPKGCGTQIRLSTLRVLHPPSEGDQIYPRTWNHEFIQLPLVDKEKQNRPTITHAEISAVLGRVKKRYAVLFALIAGTGLRIGEALAVSTT
jgi:hypothetical protein